jgi:hypothetical protein
MEHEQLNFFLKRLISYRSFSDNSLVIFDEFTSHSYQFEFYAKPLIQLLIAKQRLHQACTSIDIANLAQIENTDLDNYHCVTESLIQLNILDEVI